jgi:hypothetical protein
MRFVMDGEMPEYLQAKDLILQVGGWGVKGCGLLGWLCTRRTGAASAVD